MHFFTSFLPSLSFSPRASHSPSIITLMQTWIISCTSSVVTPTGFSTKTCFPNAAAFKTHSLRRAVGKGI